jgi:hypothetical protein
MKNNKENYIRFSYANKTWMWSVIGNKDDWYFAIPACSSEEDQSLVLSVDAIDGVDDEFLFIAEEKIPYIFIKGE